MPRKKDTELTKVIHLRVSGIIEAYFEKEAKELNLPKADVYRAALAMFMRRGGVAYAKDDD